MASITEEYLKSVLQATAEGCAVEDWTYELDEFQSKAQNFFGILVPVFLKGKRNREVISLSLVVKLAPTDERYRVSNAVTIFFQREAFIYHRALDAFKKLQDVLRLPSYEYVTPRCYFICNEYCKEAIVMQDMRAEGYQPYARDFLDLEHLELAFKAIANFHASSLITQHLNKKSYEQIKEMCPPLNEVNNKRFMDILKDRLEKGICKLANTSYSEIFARLLKSCNEYIGRIATSVSNTCICHGDLWKDNIMFKYDEKEKPMSACVIDYQTARVSSPAYDVIYLLLTSSDSTVRTTHSEGLKQLYHNTLSQLLTEAGLDADKVYSKDMFEDDWNRVTPACVIVANTALWLQSGCQQDGHVRSKQVITTESGMDIAVSRYKGLLKDIIDENIEILRCQVNYMPTYSDM